jgi:hypothetical protein
MAEVRSLAAVPEDYRHFLAEFDTDDSAYRGSWIEAGETQADWLREIAEPWWDAIRTLARADGLELHPYEAIPTSGALTDRQHWASAQLAAPDGTPYPSDDWYAATQVGASGSNDSYWEPRVPPILTAIRRDYGSRVADARRRHGVASGFGE